MAHNAATRDLHISKVYTTMRLIGGFDCGPASLGDDPYPFPKTAESRAKLFPDLDVRGGVSIGKNLCIQGNITVDDSVLIQGDLEVLGNTTIRQGIIIVTEDKNLCLASPGANVIASNILADGAGIIVVGPDPNQSKSIIWYKNNNAWNFNQDINLGQGRKPYIHGCGSDEGLSGRDYRIDGNTVLSYTSLGPSVVVSSLEAVGELQTGSINHYISVTAISVGNPTKITTAVPNGLAIGDTVRLSLTDSDPVLDGCYTVVGIASPTMVYINASVAVAGTTGQLAGVLFPINIGTSPLTCGSLQVQCCGNLVVQDNSSINRFTVAGCTGKTTINYEEQDCALQVSADYMGDYSSSQNAVCIDNATNNNDISGVSCALNVQQTYYGTNTVYGNAASTIQVIGQCINVSTTYKVPNVKISNIGLEVTAASPNNIGANFGIFVEAGGQTDITQQAIGVTGIANDGVVRIGVLGCINTSQIEIAGQLQDLYSLGGLKTGGFFCNGNAGPNEYALYSGGLSYLNGPTTITGNLSFTHATGDSLIANVVYVKETLFVSSIVENVIGGGITITGNLSPSSTETYSLGTSSLMWKTMWTEDLHVIGKLYANISSNIENIETLHVTNLFAGNAAISGNLLVDYINEATPGHGTVVDGVLIKNGNILADFIQALTLCANVLLTDVIKPKHHTSVSVEGNLIPIPDDEYQLGNTTNFWKSIYVNDVIVSGNIFGVVDMIVHKLSADIIDANIAMLVLASIEQLHTDKLGGINGNAITVTNSLLPSNSNALSLGSAEDLWSNIFTENLTVNGNGNLDNACLSGNLYVDHILANCKHPLNGVSITGNLVPAVTDEYSLGTQTQEWENIFVQNLNVSGIPDVPMQLGCTFSIGNTVTVVGAVGNNNAFFVIASVPTSFHEALFMEARVTGITSDASASYCAIIRAGILNNGSPPNNLIRMTGADQTTYQTNASGWKVRLSPDISQSVSGNNVQVEASYNQSGTPKSVTWKACVSYYPVTPL